MQRWLGAIVALIAPMLIIGACSRSELERPDLAIIGQPRGDFCERRDFAAGFDDLSLYVVLDKSESMKNDNKWAQATAALATFVDSAEVEGMRVGLQYFPQGSTCDVYALPAVPIGELPGNAPAFKASLADQKPDGETPTLPVLRAAIEYGRALQIGEPTQAVAVALVTDGAPNSCESTISKLVSVAADGAQNKPQVPTYVIGLNTGYIKPLVKIAEAGGSGEPIIIGNTGAAQQLVDALEEVRRSLKECVYGVPPVATAVVAASDVSVRYLTAGNPDGVVIPRFSNLAACSADGFVVDDELAPKTVQMCPTTCSTLQQSPKSQVTVSAGCGEGSGPVDGGVPDGGSCGSLGFSCVAQCGSNMVATPDCLDGIWVCPAGTISNEECGSCPPVPHGCCQTDGTLAVASCIDGAWVCPPGAALFGEPGCKPPEVCAALMPCPASQVCTVPDFSCGSGSTAGSCVDKPVSCDNSGPPVCGCDGKTYDNTCQAASVAQDIALVKVCPAPAGTFQCGPLFCRLADQFCRRTTDFTAQIAPDSYRCITAPAGCSDACACDLCETCPAGKVCSESCSGDPVDGVVLTCTQL